MNPNQKQSEDPSTKELNAFVQNMLKQMQDRFDQMSGNIVSRVDEMGFISSYSQARESTISKSPSQKSCTTSARKNNPAKNNDLIHLEHLRRQNNPAKTMILFSLTCIPYSNLPNTIYIKYRIPNTILPNTKYNLFQIPNKIYTIFEY